MLRFARRRKSQTRREGCGFLLFTCIVTCILLVLNSVLIIQFYPLLVVGGRGLLHHPRVVQMIMYIGPVILVFFEWWLVDLVIDLILPDRKAR